MPIRLPLISSGQTMRRSPRAAEPKSDRRSAWVTALVSALVGALGLVAGAFITAKFTYESHKSDVDAKMIEISLGILRAPLVAETAPLREWAVTEMEKRAGFTFSDQQRMALLRHPLPYVDPAAIGSAVASQLRQAVPPP